MMSAVLEVYLEALDAYVRCNDGSTPRLDAVLAERLASISMGELLELTRSFAHRMSEERPEAARSIYDASLAFAMECMAVRERSSATLALGRIQQLSKYENILQHMDSGLALFSENGRLTFVNLHMARLLGLPRKALIGRRLSELLRSRQLPRRLRRMLLHIYRDTVLYRVPYHEVTTPQGRHLIVTVTYEQELDGEVLISVKDVTEYKRIEQAAYQNDKLAILGKISASIAHEIRNPLTSIQGFMQFLKPELANLGKQVYADIILDEIERANSIIHEFLNSSKPTAPMKKPVSVQALVKDALLLFESDALMNQCTIEAGGIDPLLTVTVDLKQVKQVLMNVVKNAVEAVSCRPDAGGLVRIEAYHEAPWIKLTVTDNGPGLDPDTASRLFDPFFTTKEEGTGLGLSVSYRIIKNHGGKIDVKSRRAQGTTFIICLPS